MLLRLEIVGGSKGRYLSATWDVAELTALRDTILADDLLVNRLRTKA